MKNINYKQIEDRDAIISSMNYLMNEAKQSGFPDLHLAIKRTMRFFDIVRDSSNVIIHPSINNDEDQQIFKFLECFLEADSKTKKDFLSFADKQQSH